MSDADRDQLLAEIRTLAVGGLLADGAHHKQYELQRIAALLGFDPPVRDGEVLISGTQLVEQAGFDPGHVALDEDYSYEVGIPS